jgi:hypothetical protein
MTAFGMPCFPILVCVCLECESTCEENLLVPLTQPTEAAYNPDP